MNLNHPDDWIRFYSGLAMQALIEKGEFQSGTGPQEKSAALAVEIAKVTAKAVEQGLKTQ
jgi:hypothetical protein